VSDWWTTGYPGGSPVGPSKLARPLYAPGNTQGKPPSSDGPDVVAMKRAVSRLGRWRWQAFDDTYSQGFAKGKSGNVGESGVAGVQRQQGIEPTGSMGDATYQALRYAKIPKGLPNAGQPAFDGPAVDLLEQSHDLEAAPHLGPVWAGGKSTLDQDCTHATSGIKLYPAFDDAFSAGRSIIAPEALTVTRGSSSNPGQAFYADGVSGCRWWFGHLVSAPPVGRKFAIGEVIGTVLDHNVGGGPHVHVAINVELRFGMGKQLTHRTDYSHGAPLIGKQLAAGRPL
jgi:peptidoglycan hydrolase-like protein with peptidoglycan-binding domain